MFTCFHGAGVHGNDGNVDGGQHVDDGKDEVDLNGPVPVWLLPAEPRQAEDGQADAHLNRVKRHERPSFFVALFLACNKC